MGGQVDEKLTARADNRVCRFDRLCAPASRCITLSSFRVGPDPERDMSEALEKPKSLGAVFFFHCLGFLPLFYDAYHKVCLTLKLFVVVCGHFLFPQYSLFPHQK